MGYAIELESIDHHFYIPVRIRFGVRRLNARFLLDTGASKCSIPLIVNDRILKLRIQGTDMGIRIAGGTANYDVVLERMEVIGAKLFVENVEAWLADDFILGMNFLPGSSFK